VTTHALTSSESLDNVHVYGAFGEPGLPVNAIRESRVTGPSRCRPASRRQVQCQHLPIDLHDEHDAMHMDSCSEDELDDGTDGTTDECVICLESLAEESNIVSLPCGHLLHEACLWNLYRCAARIQGQTAKCPLCRIPLTGDAEKMAGVLADENSSVDARITAASALAKMGLAAAPHAGALVQQTRDNHAGLRSTAVTALGQMGELAICNFSAVIVERLGDDDDNVRIEARRVLQEAGELGAQILVDALMDAQSGEMIWQSAHDSLEVMEGSASRALAQALARKEGRGSGPAAKHRAITTLSHLGGKAGATGTRALVTLVSGNAFPSVRNEAAMALGNVCKGQFEGQALGIAALAAALADHDEGVRQSAASAMAKLGKLASPHITAMLHVLRHRQPLTQRHVLQALGKMGELCYAGKSMEEQLDESSLIFTIPCQIAFAKLLNDCHCDVRRTSLEALQLMGVTGAIVLASQVYKNNKDPDVADACREALQNMSTCGALVLACCNEFPTAIATDTAATQHIGFKPSHLGCAQSLASKIEVLIHAEYRSEQRPARRASSVPSGESPTNREVLYDQLRQDRGL